jgi:transposase
VAEVITVERRRRWSLADKRRIIGEALSPGASVSAVARRHELHASQLFTWCRLAREGLLDDPGPTVAAGGFAPVVVGTGHPALLRRARGRAIASPAMSRMEIVLRSGRRIIVDSGIDPAVLGRVVGVLERP